MSADGTDQLLDLAVHSLPDPHGTPVARSRQGQLKLLAILLICSLPVLVAYLAYDVIKPHGEAAFGVLISPVRPMPNVHAATLDGRSIELSTLKGQWLLVKVDGGACVTECQKQLMRLRQLRLMLGKDMDRVDWLWVVDDAAPVDAQLATHLQQDQATVLRLTPALLVRWLGRAPQAELHDSIFVIDPMGNAMMSLPAALDSAAAAKAKRDLDHLLRASIAWDSPGR